MVQYMDVSGVTLSFSAQSAPAEHQKKVTLLLYFAEYMYTQLSAGAGHQPQVPAAPANHGEVPGGGGGASAAALYMKKWFRTDRAIVMYLSNGTLQV